MRYDVQRSTFLWTITLVGEDDIQTIAAAAGEWDTKSEVVQTWLRSHTKLSFARWAKEEQKAAVNLKVNFGVKAELIALGDLAKIHQCKPGK